MVMHRLREPRVLFAVGIVLAILLFFWQAALVQGVFFLGDTSHGYFPRLVYDANVLKSGQLPLWNPLVSLGGPQIADPAAFALYPPSWLLFILLPSFIAYNYLVLIHLALAAVFMYLFVRRIGVGMWGAVCAALLYPFAGWMLTHYEHINVFFGAAYLPLLFWIIEVAFQGTNWKWFVVSALALGFYFLAAHPQLPLFAVVGLVIYAIGRASIAWRAGASWKTIAWALVQLGVLGVLGTGLAAIQLLPMAETVALSNRNGGVGNDVALQYSYPPEQLLTFVAPYFFGSPTGVDYWGRGTFREMATYIGILPLMLAGIGIWQIRGQRHNKYARLLSLVALTALLLAMGRFTPLYGALATLPLFNAVRYPPRFLFLVSFALVALVGIGLDRFISSRPSARRAKIAFAAAGICALVLIIANLLFIQHSLLQGILSSLLTILNKPKHPADFYLERLQYGLSWSKTAGFALLLFSVAAFVWLGLYSAGRISGKWLAIGAVLLGLFDLWLFNTNLPYNVLTDPRLYTVPAFDATILQQDTSLYRLYYFDHDNTAATNLIQVPLQQGNYTGYIERLTEGLRGSFNTLYGISSITGYATEDQRHFDVMHALGGVPAYDLANKDTYAQTLNLKLLSLLNGKYVTSLENLQYAGLTLINDGTLIKLYRNENVLPRAFIAAHYQVIPEPSQLLAKLISNDFDPHQTVLLEQDPQLTQNDGASGTVEITRYAPEQVDLNVDLNSPGVVVLSDTYYPGWNVRVDGAPATILNADYILRGVALSAGTHQVQFNYAPQSLFLGAIVSATSLVVLLLIALVAWLRILPFSPRSLAEGLGHRHPKTDFAGDKPFD